MFGGPLNRFLKLTAGAFKLGNYFEIEPDGTPVQHGSATVYEDLTGSLVASKLSSVAGGLQYNYAENTITMNTGGSISDPDDRLIFNYQKPHGAKNSSSMNLHIHWEQIDATTREFTVQYRIQQNLTAKTIPWSTAIINTNDTNIGEYPGSGIYNQISKLIDLDLSAYPISTLVQFRLARTDIIAGDIDASFSDAHIEYDMNGSRQEYEK